MPKTAQWHYEPSRSTYSDMPKGAGGIPPSVAAPSHKRLETARPLNIQSSMAVTYEKTRIGRLGQSVSRAGNATTWYWDSSQSTGDSDIWTPRIVYIPDAQQLALSMSTDHISFKVKPKAPSLLGYQYIDSPTASPDLDLPSTDENTLSRIPRLQDRPRKHSA